MTTYKRPRRPRKAPGERRTVRVVVMVTPEMADWIAHASWARRLSKAEWIRRAIVARLDEEDRVP